MSNIRKFFNKNCAKLANFCFVIFFVLLFILILINQYDIQLYFNGFDKLFSKELQVYFLDVGQASSTLVILPTGKSLLIDTGSGESEEKFLESVDKVLSKNKLSEIDMLVLTHSDEDHVGGAVALLKKYQVNKVFRPKILSSSAIEVPVQDMKTVDSWIYERVITSVYLEPNCDVKFIEDEVLVEEDSVIEFFACKRNLYGENDTNSFSPFITLSYNSKVFMFCGDATERREKELLDTLKEEERKLDIDFLLVAHHGSRASSSEEFLSYIKPNYAFVSAGDSLHPTQDVLDRLASCGVSEVYITKSDGMIGVAVLKGGMFLIKNMGEFFDLPLFVCIIFAIAVVWWKCFILVGTKRKFSYYKKIDKNFLQ